MEYWSIYPSESELNFAQTAHINVPVHHSCSLKDVLVQTEANQKKHLLKAGYMTVPKLSSESMTDKISLETVPYSKKIKTEDTLSERSQLYGGWLEELREIANALPSANNTTKSIVNKNPRLPELLTLVMAELEHKLALDDFKTQRAESSFWASVRVMADSRGIDFSDFEELCCSSEFKGLMCLLDSGVPGLVDRVHDSPWSVIQNPYPLTHPSGSNSISGLPSYLLPAYHGMASAEVFPQFPLETARDDTYSTANPAAFGQSPFLDYPNDLLGADSSEQGHLYVPGSLYTPLPAHNLKCEGPFPPEGNKTIPTASATPLKLKDEINQSLPVSLSSQKPKSQQRFPTTVPEACRRKIQRQRRRAMSYDHLTTNFGPSACSTWNLSNIRDSDLHFLLEKELKPSDVGTLGRIVLPKKQAEENLPPLEAKEGRILDFEDLQTSKIWHLRFRFWPNNKTRMYVLESTGDFVRLHHLQKGDSVMLYRNPATGRYVITGKRAALSKVEQLSLPSAAEMRGSGKSSFEAAMPTPTPMAVAPAPTMDESKKTNLKEVSGPSSFEAAAMPAAPTALSHMMEESSRSDADLVGSCFMGDMEDADDVIKGFSTFEPDGRSIDEIFDFKESIV